MDINEIRGLSDRDLQSALVDAKQELWKIRFDLATRQEKNYSRLPATRKQIARILTVMTERERAASDARAGEPDADAVPADAVAAAASPRRRPRSAGASTADAGSAPTAVEEPTTEATSEPATESARRRGRKAS